MLSELHNRKCTELIAVVFVMVPETFVLLVLDLAVVEHSLRVLFDLLVLLELGLECVMLKGVFRWPMLRVIWFVR